MQCVHCSNYGADHSQEKNSITEFYYAQRNKNSITIVLSDTILKQEAVNMVKGFYQTYMINGASSDLRKSHDTEKMLEEKYFTKRLIEKNRRMVFSSGGNPVVRAQDYDEGADKTVDVKYLGDGWCMVSYGWDKRINIPVKVIRSNGQIMIDYITPDRYNDAYGDSLLCDNLKTPEINFSDPLSFLKSFYDVYTLKYSSMPVNLAGQLAKLRAEHLTEKALGQFKQALVEPELDGLVGYDLLIDDFDFDCILRPTIKIVLLAENTYQMSYTIGDWTYAVNLKVVKKDNRYWIDSIERSKAE